MRRRIVLGTVAIAVALSLSGCSQAQWTPNPRTPAYGPVRTRDDAIAAARLLAAAQEPVTIVNVLHGVARDLYAGALGSFYDDQAGADEQQARLGRDAWRVDLQAIRTHQCSTPVETPFVSDIEVVIDAEFGTTLFSTETCP